MSTEHGRRLRVLVVDDSALHRHILVSLLSADPELEIAGCAASGAEALEAVVRLKPDVVTLDELMPDVDGLETARRIMRDAPTPIVMVTSTSGPAARELAEAAAAAGVLAMQDKRALGGTSTPATAELVRVIKSMASVRLVRRRREPGTPVSGAAALRQLMARPRASARPDVVAIGASTGGPQALREILARLPATFPLPVLVVQHTTAGYVETLVEWLGHQTPLRVQVAQAGEPLGAPGVYVAPTGRHLVVHGPQLALLDEPPCSLHRPSATVLFRSVAASFGPRAIGVLLTGMGDDGASGLLDMSRAGALTVAQDEASSVVFGMPAEAIRLGAAEHVLAPADIATLLVQQVEKVRRTA